MFGEDLAEAANVVRFPAELRVAASAAVLDGLEPDPREVAERLGWDLPPADLFGRADEETARHIAEQVLPLARHERQHALDGLLRPVVASAAEACRRAREAAVRVAEARSAAGTSGDDGRRLAWCAGADGGATAARGGGVADRGSRAVPCGARGRARGGFGASRRGVGAAGRDPGYGVADGSGPGVGRSLTVGGTPGGTVRRCCPMTPGWAARPRRSVGQPNRPAALGGSAACLAGLAQPASQVRLSGP